MNTLLNADSTKDARHGNVTAARPAAAVPWRMAGPLVQMHQTAAAQKSYKLTILQA